MCGDRGKVTLIRTLSLVNTDVKGAAARAAFIRGVPFAFQLGVAGKRPEPALRLRRAGRASINFNHEHHATDHHGALSHPTPIP